MARAKAKAKAKAKTVKTKPRGKAIAAACNSVALRKRNRRKAVDKLNELASELHLDELVVAGKYRRGPTPEPVERLAKALDARCKSVALKERLRAALVIWTTNGGTLAGQVTPGPSDDQGHGDEQEDTPSALPLHN
eukprot:1594329-Karenia_brevis.AAC.1